MSELTSWKEIAAHLGVSVRTAQYWEQRHGLPVSRMPGVRGRPVADAEDLTRWKQQFLLASDPELRAAPARASFKPGWLTVALSLIAAATLTFLLLGGARPLRSPRVAAVRVAEGALIATGEDGQELWRARFRTPLDERQFGNSAPQRDYSWVGDLNGDGRNEVLFAARTRPDAGGFLICYSNEGAELWRLQPDWKVSNLQRPIPNRWFPTSLAVRQSKPDASPAIWAAFASVESSPTAIVRLSAGGKPLQRYLHAGHLHVLKLWDRGPGAAPLLLAGGVSNRRNSATVVALDPDRLDGVSAEPDCPDEQLAGELSHSEVFRVFLPPTKLNQSIWDYNGIGSLLPAEGHLVIQTDEDFSSDADPRAIVRYGLNSDLRLSGVWFHDLYKLAHARCLRAGLTRERFDPEEVRHLAAKVRWEMGSSAARAH